jgi:hypothetical protein
MFLTGESDTGQLLPVFDYRDQRTRGAWEQCVLAFIPGYGTSSHADCYAFHGNIQDRQ